MSTQPIPEPIQKAPTVHMSGDIILLEVDGIVPCWDDYTFTIKIPGYGKKHVILRIKREAKDMRSVDVQTDKSEALQIANYVNMEVQTADSEANVGLMVDPNVVPKLELLDHIEFEEVDVTLGEFKKCAIAPCDLLVCPIENSLAKYSIRPFDSLLVEQRSAEKRASIQEFTERLKKRLRVL